MFCNVHLTWQRIHKNTYVLAAVVVFIVVVVVAVVVVVIVVVVYVLLFSHSYDCR